MYDINVQDLKANAPIIDYVKRFYSDKINIKRESNSMAFAQCIFHEETNASLVFYANGTYKCYGCGAHGDVITLVQQIENVDFVNACVIIANNIGYTLKDVQENKDWEEYKDKMDYHNKRYYDNLQVNPDALNYLINDRQLSFDSINNFRLGYTYQDEYAYRTDMTNIANKIAFPIMEHKRYGAKCVGFAYRDIKDSDPKYINDRNQTGQDSQDTRYNGVFVKGNLLYGLSQAYTSISDSNFIFITEGYFDVISMHQTGFSNTVGIMGTSLTDNQAKEVCKLTENIVLLLDGDKAGINAMYDHVQKFIGYGVQPKICFLNQYNDADELCKSMNFDRDKVYKFIKDNTCDGLYSIMTQSLEQHKNLVSSSRIKTYTSLRNIIDEIKAPALKDAYLKELEKELY